MAHAKCGTRAGFPTTRLALNHWLKYHIPKTYNTRKSAYNCSVYKFGFPTLTLYILHLQQLYGRNPINLRHHYARNLGEKGLL